MALASGTLVFMERAFPCKSTNLTSGFCSSFEEQGIRTNSSCPCGLDEVCSSLEFEKDKFDHKNLFVFNCETYNKMQIYDVFGVDDDIISRIM